MLNLLVFLSQANPLDILEPAPAEKGSAFSMRDGLLVLGIVLGLALVLFVLVYFARKKPRRYLESTARTYGDEEERSGEGRSRRHRSRKRRRRGDNLPRNPTLGETGGLPPARPEKPPEPAP